MYLTGAEWPLEVKFGPNPLLARKPVRGLVPIVSNEEYERERRGEWGDSPLVPRGSPRTNVFEGESQEH